MAATVVQKIAKTTSAKQRERARLVYLHRALKSHLLGGHYAAVKKSNPKEYAALRKAAEGRAKGSDGARLKMRYLVQLQLPALGDSKAEIAADERLLRVLETKQMACAGSSQSMIWYSSPQPMGMDSSSQVGIIRCSSASRSLAGFLQRRGMAAASSSPSPAS